jgi:hypothetical protein
MGTKASVEMYLCAFHLGKWEPDESVKDAYHRALHLITAAELHHMRSDDDGALQVKHADAVDRMYQEAGLNLKTATEGEKASLRMRLMDEARKAGIRFPA